MKFNNPKGLDEKCSNIYQLKKKYPTLCRSFWLKKFKTSVSNILNLP